MIITWCSFGIASCSVRGGCLRVMRVCRRWRCGVGGDCGGVSMFGVDVCGRVFDLNWQLCRNSSVRVRLNRLVLGVGRVW